MRNVQTKVEELEKQGWSYETNYNTGKCLLSEVLVKRWEDNEMGGWKTLIKYIENGKIKDYAK